MKPALHLARLVPFLLVPAIAGCDCTTGVSAIAPQIYLDACKKPSNRKVGNVFIGGYESCAVDFGPSDISVRVTKKIHVTNPSIVALNLLDVTVIGDPAFRVETTDFKGNRVGLGTGDTIGVGLSGDIVVSVLPFVEANIKAKLFIKSDANNTQQTPDGNSLVEVDLTADGVDNGIPNIVVTPLACNYDHVPVGGVKVCEVHVSNTGNRDLVLENVYFIGDPADDPQAPPAFDVPPDSTTTTPFAFAGRPPDPTEAITAGEQPITLSVQFRPDTLGHYSGKFRINSNDPDQSTINVTLDGTAVTPPTCVAKVKSVNGVAVGTSAPEIQPLDDVVFSLEDSTPSSVTGSISSFQWQNPPDGPPTSHAILSSPNNVDTGLIFDGTKVGVDFAGTYTLHGQVFDDLGVGSVNECAVTFQAIPKQNFHVELSWDTNNNDFDLHITKKDTNGDFCINSTSGVTPSGLVTTASCGDLDCNFASCRVGDGGSPDWDGDGVNQSAGDPTLDVDDIDGFGPENQNVDVMTPGDYLVGVNEYESTSDTGATAQIQIFVFGRIAASFFQSMNVGDYWEVAIIHWPADPTAPVCIEDLTDGDAHDQCG